MTLHDRFRYEELRKKNKNKTVLLGGFNEEARRE